MSDNEKYAGSYSENSFWDKVKGYAATAGKTAIEPALKMYYALQDADTPAWAKTVIIGALGYFISPIDAIPDITPILGFTDDITVLAGALATVATHIKEEHTQRAKETLKQWFG